MKKTFIEKFWVFVGQVLVPTAAVYLIMVAFSCYLFWSKPMWSIAEWNAWSRFFLFSCFIYSFLQAKKDMQDYSYHRNLPDIKSNVPMPEVKKPKDS